MSIDIEDNVTEFKEHVLEFKLNSYVNTNVTNHMSQSQKEPRGPV